MLGSILCQWRDTNCGRGHFEATGLETRRLLLQGEMFIQKAVFRQDYRQTELS